MKTLLSALTAVIIALSTSSTVLAHQSGCHRWHSCPSDTGSYICGDLGYDNYCSGEQTYYEQPDYESQGTDNGANQAVQDKSTIISNATNDAQKAGEDDGYSDSTQSDTVLESDFCSRTFTFNGYAPQEYQDAFYSSYQDACLATYNDAYAGVYDSAFEQGQQRYAAELADDSTVPSSNDSSDSGSGGDWVWPVVIGGGIVSYMVSAIRNSKK
jgi:hypothetical protein